MRVQYNVYIFSIVKTLHAFMIFLGRVKLRGAKGGAKL